MSPEPSWRSPAANCLSSGSSDACADRRHIVGAAPDVASVRGEAGQKLDERLRAGNPEGAHGDLILTVAMLPAEIEGSSEGRTTATNASVRSVFVVGPDKRIRLMLTYPKTTGRNFDEILRVLDSMQLTAWHKVATPVNWQPGDDIIIAESVSDDDAKTMFPAGWKAHKPYLRITKQSG